MKRKMYLMLFTVLMLTSVIGAASCGTAATPTVTQTTTPTTTVAPGPSATVIIDSNGFSPATLTIAVGTTVTWTNNDDAQHMLTSLSGYFASSALNKGESFSYTFTKSGTNPYFCKINPSMSGKIIVQ
jgi:plastocyanin